MKAHKKSYWPNTDLLLFLSNYFKTSQDMLYKGKRVVEYVTIMVHFFSYFYLTTFHVMKIWVEKQEVW